MPEPIQIQGKDYYVNVAVIRGSSKSGEVNIVIELYDEEPSFTNGEASAEPVKTIHCYGDAGSLYYQLKVPLQEWVAALSLPFTAIALIGLALVLYLLTPENYLTIRQALPGAIFFSLGWITVTKLFQLYVARYSRYDATYLALASIIMSLAAGEVSEDSLTRWIGDNWPEEK